MSNFVFDPQQAGAGVQSALPAAQRLPRNPMLPQHPLGAYTDAQYEASLAQLRYEISQQYNNVLQQLGYAGEGGEFTPGTVEIGAQRQRRDLQRGSTLAEEEVTKRAQREGTLFSGIRGRDVARSQHPFVSALADLDVDVPRQLSGLYGQATGLIDQYTLQQNQMLADAAARASSRIAQQSTAAQAAAPIAEPPPPQAPIDGSTGSGYDDSLLGIGMYSPPAPGEAPAPIVGGGSAMGGTGVRGLSSMAAPAGPSVGAQPIALSPEIAAAAQVAPIIPSAQQVQAGAPDPLVQNNPAALQEVIRKRQMQYF